MQEIYYTMKDLVGKLPKPLPQSYPAIKRFMIKHCKDIKMIGSGDWVRYSISKTSLEKLIKDFLG